MGVIHLHDLKKWSSESDPWLHAQQKLTIIHCSVSPHIQLCLCPDIVLIKANHTSDKGLFTES